MASFYRSSKNSLSGAYTGNTPLNGTEESCSRFKSISIAAETTTAGTLSVRNGDGNVEASLVLAADTRARLVVPVLGFSSYTTQFLSSSSGTITECEVTLHQHALESSSAASGPSGNGDASEATLSTVASTLAGTLNVSASALPLPDGAATQATLSQVLSAIQATLNVSDSAMLTAMTANAAAVNANGNDLGNILAAVQGTLAVSATELPLPTGAATNATLVEVRDALAGAHYTPSTVFDNVASYIADTWSVTYDSGTSSKVLVWGSASETAGNIAVQISHDEIEWLDTYSSAYLEADGAILPSEIQAPLRYVRFSGDVALTNFTLKAVRL